ncbi:calcium/proton exchanger [Tanacetum coccineum]
MDSTPLCQKAHCRTFHSLLENENEIGEKFLINVSLGQCKIAKQRALFDYEGGLKEHYGRLWEYRQVILDSNPGFTCRLDDGKTKSGNYYFRRIYVCFKGVKDGWLAGCRKVIRLDGCFLKHTCRGELLVAMGRDANNQMYPIAWVVVKVENNENWCWFISLIQKDLQLQTGEGLTIISDSHKLLGGLKEEGEGVREEEKVVREEKEGEHMTEDEIRKNLEHEYMEVMLLHVEQKFEANDTQQDEFDQEVLRYTLEEEARFKWEDEEKSVAANMSDMGERGFRLGDIEAKDNYKSNAELGIPSVDPIDVVTTTASKGKQVAEPSEQHDLQPLPKKRG